MKYQPTPRDLFNPPPQAGEPKKATPKDFSCIIPGWTVAIFYDSTGKPYWRSDGRSLSEGQPEMKGKE